MDTNNEKIKNLVEYVRGIRDNKDSKKLYLAYKEDIEKVTPSEAFDIFYSLIDEGTEPSTVLVFLDKVINVFYKSLGSYQWQKPKNDNFLQDLILENNALVEKTDRMKEILLRKESLMNKKQQLFPKIKELSKFHNFKPLILLNFFSKQKWFHPINVEYIK